MTGAGEGIKRWDSRNKICMEHIMMENGCGRVIWEGMMCVSHMNGI